MPAQPHPFPTWGQPLFGGGPHTAADVERIPDDGFRYEIYRGVLIRMPGTGEDHGLICQFISEILSAYWRALGERYRVVQNVGFDFTFTGDPAQTTMLVPDVAVKADNIRHGPGIGQIPSLLAVEVVSPSEYRPEMTMKANFYLNGGVKEVWIIWPKTRTVDVWMAPNNIVILAEPQMITSPLLPGFSCALTTFFDG
jgi:Uma2 family endonuclease